MKKTGKIVVIITVCIILSICLVGYLYKSNSPSGITAFDGKIIADSIAHNWSSNASLGLINKGSIIFDDGQFESWGYYYLNNATITAETSCIGITVTSEGNTFIRYNVSIGDMNPLSNISIDSDEAYNIAQENQAINSFLKNGPHIETFLLGSLDNNSVWILKWVDPGFMDDPKWAEIHIDATTGEVLYVHADT